jgi:hypothetical protein
MSRSTAKSRILSMEDMLSVECGGTVADVVREVKLT